MSSVVFDKETRKQISAMRLKINRTFAGEGGAAVRARGIGAGHDFHDHRSYTAGDDFRHIDWNLFGRHGDLFIKRFRQEADLEFLVVLDRSASMKIGTPSKDVFGRRLACALAACFAASNQPFHLTVADQTLTPLCPPVRSDSDLEIAMNSLEEAPEPNGILDSSDFRIQPAAGLSRVIIFIGDLLDESDFLNRLANSRNDRTEIVVALVCSEDERAPKLNGKVCLKDVEGTDDLRLQIDEELLSRYVQAFDQHLKDQERKSKSLGLSMVVLDVESTLDRAIIQIAKKGALAR